MSLAAPAVAVAFIDKTSLLGNYMYNTLYYYYYLFIYFITGSGVNSGPLLPTPQTSLLGTPQMVSL